jgi:hypothetical protein
LNNLLRHNIMCTPSHMLRARLRSRHYESLVWLMRSLAFCSIYKSTQPKKKPPTSKPPEFHREFQLNLLKAAFAIVSTINCLFLYKLRL